MGKLRNFISGSCSEFKVNLSFEFELSLERYIEFVKSDKETPPPQFVINPKGHVLLFPMIPQSELSSRWSLKMAVSFENVCIFPQETYLSISHHKSSIKYI